MQANMVRQPILSSQKDLLGYELCYQDHGASLYNQADTTAANVIEDFLMQINSDRLLAGATAFLTFTPNLLTKNIFKMFQPDKMVIQIEDNATVHPMAQKIIYRCKMQGYRIAVKGFEFSARYFGLLDVIDIVKIDFGKEDPSFSNIVQMALSLKKQVVAYNVNTQAAYDRALAMGCQYFQGSAVAAALSSKIPKMEHLQSNFFQLVVAVTKDEPDIDEIATIISRDVTLAFSLIKLVNSAYFALRNRARSVKQALVVLGLGQLKQWVYLLSFKNNDRGELSSELIKISFLRASFCQELAAMTPKFPLSKSESYLMGMFSTLGLLMEVPLESAISELPIAQEIKNALLTGEGMAGTLFTLVLSYENADWEGVNACAEALGITTNRISQKYFECCDSVNTIWNTLTNPGKAPAIQDDEYEEPVLDGEVVRQLREEQAQAQAERRFAAAQAESKLGIPEEERVRPRAADKQRGPRNKTPIAVATAQKPKDEEEEMSSQNEDPLGKLESL